MPEDQTGGRLYLIERLDENTDCRYYAEHGEIGGVPDAAGYDLPAHARKFRTEAEAQDFINTQLPEWGRGLHRPVALGPSDFLWDASALAAMLLYGIEVPNRVLESTPGRLRLWRRD